MKKQMKTYAIEFNGQTKFENTTREGIANASVGVFSDGHWFATLTTQTDPIKAARAARGSNHYCQRYVLADSFREVTHAGPAYKRNAS